MSALLGPNLANLGKDILSEGLYVGSYLCLSLLTLLSDLDTIKMLLNDDDLNWKKYVFGCIKIFKNEYNISKGMNILIGGNIPVGFGMSSSAALEVSLLASFIHAFENPIDIPAQNRQ